MRKGIRAVVAVLLAYQMQATVLPHLKIAGNILELLIITVYTIGYAMGLYAGLMAGGLAALIMEVSAGDLPGLTAVICVVIGWLGSWTARQIKAFKRPGQRRLESRVRRFAPMVILMLYVAAKEMIYAGYFYIIGMEVGASQFLGAALAGLYTGALSLVLFPFTYNFLMRRPDETLVAKSLAKRRAKGKAKRLKDEKAGMPIPAEGGTEDA